MASHSQMKKLSPVDREALERAIRLLRERGGADALQTDRMLADKERPWIETALSAVFVCQSDALHLRPWQPPPCWLGDDRPVDDFPLAGRVAAWELRRRLIASGLSAFEPDPITALHSKAEAQAT